MKLEIDGESLMVEVAESLYERAKGLSFREEGKMLFKFPRPTRAKIDMMFLSDSLHLYFMDSEKKVIDIQRAEPWSFDPRTWKLYSPGRPYKYLLESFEELNLSEGDAVDF